MDKQIRELERRVATGDLEAASALERLRLRADAFPDGTIIIDGERCIVEELRIAGRFTGLACLQLEDQRAFYVAESAEIAGLVARAYWQDMAESDPEEFQSCVGTEALVAWGLGHSYAVGSTSVSSLTEWLDLWLDTPEEEFARYDGAEVDIEAAACDVREQLGFNPTVAYRYD